MTWYAITQVYLSNQVFPWFIFTLVNVMTLYQFVHDMIIVFIPLKQIKRNSLDWHFQHGDPGHGVPTHMLKIISGSKIIQKQLDYI